MAYSPSLRESPGQIHKASAVPNSDPCQIITPLVLVGLGLGVGEGLGLGNHIAISTRGVIIWQGVENGHNTGTSRHKSYRRFIVDRPITRM